MDKEKNDIQQISQLSNLNMTNKQIIEILENAKTNLVIQYTQNQSKIKLMEFLNKGFIILKWAGFKAFFLAQNFFGLKENHFRFISAFSSIAGAAGQMVIERWIDKHEMTKEQFDLAVGKLDEMLYEKWGEEIFPELRDAKKAKIYDDTFSCESDMEKDESAKS